MQRGDYVICNDLLGIIETVKDDTVIIRDKDYIPHEVLKDNVHLIIDAFHLASRFYRRIIEEKN